MNRSTFLAVLVTAVVATATSSIARAADLPLDACRLSSASDIRAALGAAPKNSEPDGPTEVLKGSHQWVCTHEAGSFALAVEVTRTPSPAAAVDIMDTVMAAPELNKMISNSPLMKMTSVSGLGDKAAWFQQAGIVSFATLSGRYFLSMSLVGEGDLSRMREPLQRLTAAALGRLPR